MDINKNANVGGFMIMISHGYQSCIPIGLALYVL